MTYTVTAPLVIARDKDGHNHHVYEGGVIDWLGPEQKEHFLAEGLVSEGGRSEEDAPAKSAAKPVWVDFAVSKGYSREEAEDMNKDDLIEALS